MRYLLAWLKAAAEALLPRLAGLALLAFMFYQFFFAELPSRAVVLNQELGIRGRVAYCSNSRGYLSYLGSPAKPYDFTNFCNEQLAPSSSLGSYLQPGDSVAKQPQATYLLLWRHHQLSRWELVPPRP